MIKINKIFIMINLNYLNSFMGMGIGDWGLGIGDWAQSPIPNPQSPIPNPQSPLTKIFFNKKKIILILYL
jgi:hypothetical protein